jgi:hypothetical protein
MSKDLVAVTIDANDSYQEKVIGSGETADFAKAVGFYLTQEIHGESMPSGTFPIIYWDGVRDLEGKMLTICDAVLSDKTQLESVKSLVRNTLHDWYANQSKPIEYVANK